MSYNGSGTFQINSSGQPVVTGTTISATVFNALTADLATGLTTALTKDGQTTPTANIPLGGFKLTGVAAATARTDAASLATIQDGTGLYAGTVGGTADAITITLSPVITAYVAGQCFSWIASGTNTTSVTVNVNGVGAKAVTKNGSTALAAGDITSGCLVVATYDGTRFQLASTYYPAVNRGGDTMTGALTAPAVTVSNSSAGSDVTATVTNTDNSNAASNAVEQITVGGSSAGDPKVVLTVTGGSTFSVGVDNSDSDKFKIGHNAAVGTNTDLTLDTSGNLTVAGTLATTGFTIFDAAGDLLYATAADTNARLAIGTARQILRTNSGATAPAWDAQISLMAITTLSGNPTSVSFTSIPNGVRRVKVFLSGVSTSGTSGYLLQVGTSTTPDTTSYVSGATIGVTVGSSTAGFLLVNSPAAADDHTGTICLDLVDASTNLWCANGNFERSSDGGVFNCAGKHAISGNLNMVKLTTVGGTDTLDNGGIIGVSYE